MSRLGFAGLVLAGLLAACSKSEAKPASPPAGTVIFEASGQGHTETDAFVAPTRVQVCYEATRTGGGPTPGEFVIIPEGKRLIGSTVATDAGRGCSYATVGRGRFYIEVVADGPVVWHVTVKTA